MPEYADITPAETAAENPLKETLLNKFRDNVLAIAAGDATVPDAKRIQPGALRRPVAGTVRIASQSWPNAVATTSWEGVFTAIAYVPGVYVLAYVPAGNVRSRILVNGTIIFTQTGTAPVEETITLANGGSIVVELRWDSAFAGGTARTEDLRLMADYVPPMGQVSFR